LILTYLHRLYFVSNPSTNIDAALSTVNALVQGIETNFPTATRLLPWSLSYRAFRDTIPLGHQSPSGADGKPRPYAHSYQHLLQLSSLASNRTYVYTQPVAQQGTVTSIPARQQDAHANILKMSALWAPRHTVFVRDAASYSGGLCTIQIGELRAVREGAGAGAVSSPGIVVCITTVVGADNAEDGLDSGYTSMENGTAMDVDEEEPDFEFARTIIHDCWSKIKEGRDLGRSEVRDFMMAPVATTRKEYEREAAVRMWCDALRMRG
jgi:hypothetical protein